MKELIKELKFWESTHILKDNDRETLQKIISDIENQSIANSVSSIPLEDLEHLIAWNLSKNHTDKYGVIKGKYSRTYSYMNKNKKKVLKWLKDNYR